MNFDSEEFQQNMPKHYRSILAGFRKCARSLVLLHSAFATLAVVELFALCYLLQAPQNTSLIAVALGAPFLTLFSYLALLFYYQAKKPQQLSDLLQHFIASCRTSLGVPRGVAIHHLSIAGALMKLSQYLTDEAWLFAREPNGSPFFAKLSAQFSVHCYGKSIFSFKQLLLQAAIDEHLDQIRSTPTDLELHASLANAHVALSQMYKQRNGAPFDAKRKTATSLAMEEFAILNHYAPNDPWVHEQLAAGFRELGLPQEEIREVEFLLTLRPTDQELLFRLGTLYFEQGMNAKGLQVYESLKKSHFQGAEALLAKYGETYRT